MFNTGDYSPHMGHASSFIINGTEVLEDDKDGSLTYSRLPKAGDWIESRTACSTIRGRVMARAGRFIKVVGEGEGALNSILGGISCHARWTVKVHSVDGTFGKFIGSNCVERYEAAKGTHRALFTKELYTQYGRHMALTAKGEEACRLLGWTQEYAAVGDVFDGTHRRSMWTAFDRVSLDGLNRLRKVAAFKASYKGTHLNKAMAKAGLNPSPEVRTLPPNQRL